MLVVLDKTVREQDTQTTTPNKNPSRETRSHPSKNPFFRTKPSQTNRSPSATTYYLRMPQKETNLHKDSSNYPKKRTFKSSPAQTSRSPTNSPKKRIGAKMDQAEPRKGRPRDRLSEAAQQQVSTPSLFSPELYHF